MQRESNWFVAMIVLASLLIVGICVIFAPKSHASDATESDSIRQVMMSTWNKPETPLVVDPVVVDGEAAIAGWSQGEIGGRALLRKRNGHWVVVLCSGDQLKSAATLQTAGLNRAAAERLSAKLADSEKTIPSARLALFAKFDGLVNVEGHTDHAVPKRH